MHSTPFAFNMSIDSMIAIGNASISEDTIDLNLNLLTEGRKDLDKIPFIRYVLVGDEKVPSLKLEVTGKLSDPDIINSALEEVVTLSFDICLRIMSLPVHWMDDVFSDEESDTHGDSNSK